jgi:hypothetical protein
MYHLRDEYSPFQITPLTAKVETSHFQPSPSDDLSLQFLTESFGSTVISRRGIVPHIVGFRYQRALFNLQ